MSSPKSAELKLKILISDNSPPSISAPFLIRPVFNLKLFLNIFYFIL